MNCIIMKRFLYRYRVLIIVFCLSAFAVLSCRESEQSIAWPEVTEENKPWTRWWWQGNIVNEDDLTVLLEEYRDAGLGGVEITPIYGVKDYEDQFIDFLSEEFIMMLGHTLDETGRLNMGVDMATGTGWPFGGSWIDSQDACKYMTYKTYMLTGGEALNEPVEYIQGPMARAVRRRVDIESLVEPISRNDSLQTLALEQVRFEKPLPLVTLMAYSGEGEVVDLTERIDEEGRLDWTAPEGDWTLYAVFQGWHGKMVERAGPGGEGNVIDHFSETALVNYLNRFDSAFAGHDISSLRAWFNDSYEVDDAWGEADFTPELFKEFMARRGYDPRENLPALFGRDTVDNKHIRVLCDYRETISELLLDEFTIPWRGWAEKNNAIIRNQAHGSPANILDLYAASSIPETEGEDMLSIKFASSAGNVTGKRLIACEAATWLNEHFKATLAETKYNLERYFLGGVNHVVYHGTCYSPPDVPWPGWMFYASVHYAPTNTFWNDFPALNNYITRCQSFLQRGTPDNDLLLYFPFYDRISTPGRSLLEHFSGGGSRSFKSDFRMLAGTMTDNGYLLDYISDRQLTGVSFENDRLASGESRYQVIVLPECAYISVETFSRLLDLANEGATIIVHNALPRSVKGYGDFAERNMKYNELINELEFEVTGNADIQKAVAGKGMFLSGSDIEYLLDYAGVKGETLVDKGLHFIRRNHDDGKVYYIVNRGEKYISEWVPLQTDLVSTVLFNPMSGQTGVAFTRVNEKGQNEVFLQLMPGEACLLKLYDININAATYPYLDEDEQEVEIKGTWTVDFIEGGPELPAGKSIDDPLPWTDLEGEAVKNFSGTASYTIDFEKPGIDADIWILDPGKVAESATILLNGDKIGTVFADPYRIQIPDELLKEVNTLEIRVSNLMANRIAWMDRQGIEYKRFYNINFPSRLRENMGEDGLFTAADWPVMESGLTGPVKLIPAKILKAVKDF